MNRYTLEFKPLEPSVTVKELRDELEQVLLRLHPRVTYKLGQVYKNSYGKLIAEIAMDGQRSLLNETLKSKQWGTTIAFERLRWGWFSDNEDAALLVSVTGAIKADPLAGVAPIEGTGEYVLRKRLLHGRYIALMIATLAVILLLIANVINTRSPVLEGLYIAFFAIFMFTLNDTPIDIRVYAEKITLTERMLIVSFWLLKKPVSLEWEKIWGLDYTSPVCKVLSEGSKTRFLLSERFGCQDKSIVLKTIADRANLMYVDGNFQNSIYRKPDAGDNN